MMKIYGGGAMFRRRCSALLSPLFDNMNKVGIVPSYVQLQKENQRKGRTNFLTLPQMSVKRCRVFSIAILQQNQV